MVGRKPIGEQPLSKTERQQRWRRRKAIFKEECERYELVSGADLVLDQKMLAAFSRIADDIPEMSLNILIFTAMCDFLNSKPEYQVQAMNQGIDDLDKHLYMLDAAVFASAKRLSEEFKAPIQPSGGAER